MLTNHEMRKIIDQYCEKWNRLPACDICHTRIGADLDGWAVAVSQDRTVTFLCPECKEVELGV